MKSSKASLARSEIPFIDFSSSYGPTSKKNFGFYITVDDLLEKNERLNLIRVQKDEIELLKAQITKLKNENLALAKKVKTLEKQNQKNHSKKPEIQRKSKKPTKKN